MYTPDSPASMSMHEEGTVSVAGPMMAVFNNLVMFDQQVKQNSLESIVPDLATGWAWSEDGTALTFPLRQGVNWHDGRPFTSEDVKCTWDLLLEKSGEKLRVNPRKSFYQPRSRHHQRRGHLSSETAAAGVSDGSRNRVPGDLPLPCAAARHAQSPDRHRPVQIRRVQAERADQADPQPGLLETGPALSRRHRIYGHPQRVDRGIGIRFRESST
jgi:hypothetical protein